MSAVPKERKLTVAEYLAIEKAAERKSEFFDGQMFLMAGASLEHNVLSRNLAGLLFAKLRGGPCQVFVADLRVQVEKSGLFTYPDLMIVCGAPEHAAEDRDTIVNPKVVIEVLSDSTERYDRTTKFRHYKQLDSVQEYVLVSQNEALVECFTRQANGTWTQADFVGLTADMALNAVAVSIPMAEIYRGIEFPSPSKPTAP